MALKHYYCESNDVKPKSRGIEPLRSIQFDLTSEESEEVLVNIEQPTENGLRSASVLIPLSELKEAYNWLSK